MSRTRSYNILAIKNEFWRSKTYFLMYLVVRGNSFCNKCVRFDYLPLTMSGFDAMRTLCPHNKVKSGLARQQLDIKQWVVQY